MSDELVGAERGLRGKIWTTESAPMGGEMDVRDLWLVMQELDRLRAVEKAAAALVGRWDNGDFRVGPVGNALLSALADALNGGAT